MKKIGLLRVLQDEETIIPCLISIAPIMNDVVIIWSEDIANLSISKAKEWAPYLESRYGLKLHFAQYPHHVVRPHSIDDLRILSPENRIDTYVNYGMDITQQLYTQDDYLVTKIDSDQVYIRPHFEQALAMVKSPQDAVAIQGYNSLVHYNGIYLYGARRINGGGDSLICGQANLLRCGIAPHYEIDIAKHTKTRACPLLCWMHFMKDFKTRNIIRMFQANECLPISTIKELPNVYTEHILPHLIEGQSLYQGLTVG
ncbi:MAG: hypothetical protein R3Y56_08490 [Akkermansia sp.]